VLADREPLPALHHRQGPEGQQHHLGPDLQGLVRPLRSFAMARPELTMRFWPCISMFYGRKGMPIAALSVVDLGKPPRRLSFLSIPQHQLTLMACFLFFSHLGSARQDPRRARLQDDRRSNQEGDPLLLHRSCSRRGQANGCVHLASSLQRRFVRKVDVSPCFFSLRTGFWGAKVALPCSPAEGHIGMKKNIEWLKKHRQSVGPDFPRRFSLPLLGRDFPSHGE
jgi:hypothetical protein